MQGHNWLRSCVWHDADFDRQMEFQSATTLATFNVSDGAFPDAGLIMDAAGNLFGTASSGGSSTFDGTVFEITP